MDAADWIARRRMLALRLWGPGLSAPESVVGHLTAMQAQEHRYARWSVAQRMKPSPVGSTLDRAFDDGQILRTHVLRPTWHYVAPQDLRWLLALSGPRVDAANARRYQELGLDAGSLTRATGVIAESVAGSPRTRRELARILEAHGISAAGQRIAYILMHAELTAVICSGPMKAKEHTYAAFDERVVDNEGPEGDEATAELARRYFATRGPATLKDFVWWSGLSTADARRGLQMTKTELASRVVGDRTYWFADQKTPRAASRIDLVQCYDESIISYSQSRDALHTSSVNFPVPRHLNGFVHVLLRNGRLLGHWRALQNRDGPRVDTRVDRRLDREERIALGHAIDRYHRFSAPQVPNR